LELTKALVLTGAEEAEEQEIAAYATLMEEREPLVAKLTELKQEIDSEMLSSPEFAAIRQAIQAIADLDSRHLAIISRMREHVQKSHKEVKIGQRIHAGYVDLAPDSTSRRFDIKH
jgi:hypothetical protein